MSPEIQDAIHTRIDYMEKGLKEQMGHLADSMAKMAHSIEKISDRTADQSLLIQRINQHALQIDNVDKRMDAVEQTISTHGVWIEIVKKGTYTAIGVIVTALLGATAYYSIVG